MSGSGRRAPNERRIPSLDGLRAISIAIVLVSHLAGTRNFPWWGEKNCMWSNDYPHFNMTFPHSRNVVEHHLKAEEMFPFYASLRAAVSDGKGKKKK